MLHYMKCIIKLGKMELIQLNYLQFQKMMNGYIIQQDMIKKLLVKL